MCKRRKQNIVECPLSANRSVYGRRNIERRASLARRAPLCSPRAHAPPMRLRARPFTNLNTPPQSARTPIICARYSRRARASGLVNTSAALSSVLRYSSEITPRST